MRVFQNAEWVTCILVKPLIRCLQGCAHGGREVRDGHHAVLFKISNQWHGIQPLLCINSVFIYLRISLFWLIIQYNHVLFLTAKIKSVITVHVFEEWYHVKALLLTCLPHPIQLQTELIFSTISGEKVFVSFISSLLCLSIEGFLAFDQFQRKLL